MIKDVLIDIVGTQGIDDQTDTIEFSSDDGVIVRIGFADLFRMKEFEFEDFLLRQSPKTYIFLAGESEV